MRLGEKGYGARWMCFPAKSCAALLSCENAATSGVDCSSSFGNSSLGCFGSLSVKQCNYSQDETAQLQAKENLELNQKPGEIK